MADIVVADILEEKLINLSLQARTKAEVIKELATLLYDAGYIVNLDEYIHDVYLREAEGITGMGNNVAIPHGKSKGVRQASVAIGRTNSPIEWESYDDQPVQLFFLFAVPNDKEGAQMHLKLLSQLATKLANDETLNDLKQARTIIEFKNIITTEEGVKNENCIIK